LDSNNSSFFNHIIPDVLIWSGKARYRPHFTHMQEPSGIEKRDMTITSIHILDSNHSSTRPIQRLH
jgi:hypothetical protein